MTSVIQQADFIQSVEAALQYISYYHPTDFIQAMAAAYEREESTAAKDAMAQILINSRMAAMGHRPICQDTGIVCAFVRVGMDVCWDKTDLTVQQMVDEGARRAYLDPNNPLRASVLQDPVGARKNTRDNTPAVVHVELVPGDQASVEIAAKGGGSEFKSKFKVLNPNDDLVQWVLDVVPTMGAGWCPPGILGIGVGGTAEKAMLLAKSALNEPIDMQDLLRKGPSNRVEELRIELYEKVNALGIGAQGLGGLTTVLDVKISDYPTHAATLPVALIPNCASTRHAHFTLDGSGPAEFDPPALSHWPDIHWDAAGPNIRKLNVDQVTETELLDLKAGETVLLTGRILTGRDAAHKRLQDLAAEGGPLPVDLKGRFIYYVGPVPAVGDEIVGPAGPTTATRMDKFTDFMLSDDVGVWGMIGKAERGDAAIASIQKHQSVYLMAVGGAAYLVSKAIKHARCVAFEDLGMEAIYEFEVVDMPVTVAVDSTGGSVHKSGPALWQRKIAGIPVVVQGAP